MPIVEQPTVQTCVPTLPHNGPLPLHHHSSSLCFSLTATHAATPFPITSFTLTIFSQLLLRLARAIRSRRWKRRRRRRRRDDIESLLYLSIYLSRRKWAPRADPRTMRVESWIRRAVAGFCTRREMEGNLFDVLKGDFNAFSIGETRGEIFIPFSRGWTRATRVFSVEWKLKVNSLRVVLKKKKKGKWYVSRWMYSLNFWNGD